mmetsp:Transcript_8606/g.28709  ORF Transcript_8606/g.28709 Transcript_8606/m.28709 type:complete len:285 (-) Transcript_8606:2940-3794(-)
MALRVGGVPEHFNLPWQLARERKLFEQEGLQVEWKDFPGGTGAMTKALNDGEADVCVLLTEGIVKDIVCNKKSKIVSTFVSSPLCWGIHTGAKQQDVTAVKDLNEKIWAISRFTSGSHLMAFVLAKQEGWDTASLKFKTVGDIKGAQEALTDGSANGFLWEKFMTKPLVDGGVFRRVGEIPTPWPCFVIAVRNEILQERSADVRKMIDIVQKVCQEFKADETSPALVAQTFEHKYEDACEWMKSVEWSSACQTDREMILKVAHTLAELNIIQEIPDVSEIVKDI